MRHELDSPNLSGHLPPPPPAIFPKGNGYGLWFAGIIGPPTALISEADLRISPPLKKSQPHFRSTFVAVKGELLDPPEAPRLLVAHHHHRARVPQRKPGVPQPRLGTLPELDAGTGDPLEPAQPGVQLRHERDREGGALELHVEQVPAGGVRRPEEDHHERTGARQEALPHPQVPGLRDGPREGPQPGLLHHPVVHRRQPGGQAARLELHSRQLAGAGREIHFEQQIPRKCREEDLQLLHDGEAAGGGSFHLRAFIQKPHLDFMLIERIYYRVFQNSIYKLLGKMRSFFAKYPDAGAGKRRRQQALEAVQNNIRWIQSHVQGLQEWLEVEGPTPWYSPRLPSHVVPEHYDLHLHPSLTQGRFKGRVSIFVALQKPTDRLLVHAAKLLNVSAAQVWSLRESIESEKMEIQERAYNEENEYLVLKMGEKLPFGRYRLYFEFEGPLTLSLKGFYKSSYLDPQTQQRKNDESCKLKEAFIWTTTFKNIFTDHHNRVDTCPTSYRYNTSSSLPSTEVSPRRECLEDP
ncbi:hypothetical protein AVEN_270670-1 [Araneus ventricosus]|uniref:Aminopeptidase N-like N-terminal domain-containing protein n=1 Tax=Araneus ventricosus TaxID=182803 RepID=A0A4Y2PBF4_ARAVE|nr:hypothetical protein AVEN_270670-1 [Araneus ventricosus]